MIRPVLVAHWLVGGLCLSLPALAGSTDDCAQNADSGRRITAWSKIIKGESAKSATAEAYKNRADAFADQSADDKAMDDFASAIALPDGVFAELSKIKLKNLR